MDSKENKSFCKETEVLLRSWNMEELISDFKEKQVDLEVLKNLTTDDINLLIECFGLRIRFRTRLNEWREHNDLPPLLENTNRDKRRTNTKLGRNHLGESNSSEAVGRNFAEKFDAMNEIMGSPQVSYTQNNNTAWSHNTFNLDLPISNFFKGNGARKLTGAQRKPMIQYPRK